MLSKLTQSTIVMRGMPNDRRDPSPNDQIRLMTEIDAVCPLCGKPLLYEKSERLNKMFEVAHIYPLNPTAEEKNLLEGEKRLSQDVNSNDNLIPLCPNCHEKFDKPRTIEEYRALVAIKKQAVTRRKLIESESAFVLSEAIRDVVQKLLTHQHDATVASPILTYDLATVDRKLGAAIPSIFRARIHDDVRQYFGVVRDHFRDLEPQSKITAMQIASQVRTYYLGLAQQQLSKIEVYTAISNWIARRTGCMPQIADVITSYFVQSCEVFDANP